jgi:alkylresorcinol/alkylpyrone synthase
LNAAIYSLGTANPARYASQREVYDFLVEHFHLAGPELDLYRRILLEGPIRGRHVGVSHDEQAANHDPDKMNERFRQFASATGTRAAAEAMRAAGADRSEIGALVVSTCTGYLCPGLSSYIAEQLGLRDNVKTFDLVGMGCGAALPALECAASLIGGGLDRPVLVVAAEVCSATMFMGPDEDLIVSNSIFGDGAAAAVLGPASLDNRTTSLRLLDFESGLQPRHREALRYRMQDGRLRNTLSRRVPVLAARALEQVVARLLSRHEMSVADVPWWIVHPGGSAVLDQVGRQLGLADHSLRFSHEIFRDYGNMSSPSVLFVLQRTLRDGQPRRGQRGVLASFGAGFSAGAALVEFA